MRGAAVGLAPVFAKADAWPYLAGSPLGANNGPAQSRKSSPFWVIRPAFSRVYCQSKSAKTKAALCA